jgi:anti-sigma factor RsiW
MAAAEHDLHTLSGAYALDALPPDERELFTAHLTGCEPCRQEVAEFGEAAARLGQAVAVTPRPELRAATLRAAALTSQLAPEIEPGPVPAPAPGGAAGPRPVPRLAPGTDDRWRARRGLLRPAWLATAAAAVILVAAVAVGVVIHGANGRLHSNQRQAHMIAAVLTAPDAVMMSSKVRTGGTATVVMSHRERALVFSASGLRRLPPGRAYELWVMWPGGQRAAGMLTMPASGAAGPAVIPGLAAGDAIGLTVEPAAGSARPTTAPVLVMRLGRT